VIKEEDKLIISASPHIRNAESIPKIMWTVVGALAPAGIVGIFMFGYRCLWIIFLCVATTVIIEAVCQKLRGRSVTINDGSAVITGLLLAYTLPPGVPIYIPIIGAAFGIIVVKHTFGGLGNNIWNPALAARAFLQIAYPTSMNSGWLNFKQTDFLQDTKSTNLMGEQIVDAVTRATPLAKEISRKVYNYLDLLFGNVPGCIGEVSAIAIILGGFYLIYKGYVNWRVPSGFIGTVFILSWVLPPGIKTPWANDPLYHILAGGLMLGAFFMATDMVTTPLTHKGLTIFGIGCGLLTVLIRFYGGYPEGVCYAILLMNTATPLIDRCTQPKLLGTSNRKRM
jgi:electron transport complex protein RnfD